jgi:hypothetical protein
LSSISDLSFIQEFEELAAFYTDYNLGEGIFVDARNTENLNVSFIKLGSQGWRSG